MEIYRRKILSGNRNNQHQQRRKKEIYIYCVAKKDLLKQVKRRICFIGDMISARYIFFIQQKALLRFHLKRAFTIIDIHFYDLNATGEKEACFLKKFEK